MADNKLFYTVSEGNAESFKDAKKDEKVIGLIRPSQSTAPFGYFISGGQQYGASYTDIAEIAEAKADTAYANAKQYADDTFATNIEVGRKFNDVNNKFSDYALKSEITDNDTKPNGSASFTSDGAKWTISFDDNGKISVNKYVATTVSSVSVPQLSANTTGRGGGKFYVGYNYNVVVGIDVTSTSQPVTATFKNDTKQAFEVKVWDGSTYCYTYSMPAGLSTPSITFTSTHVMSDVANRTYTGAVAFNTTYTPSVSTSGEKTFTVFVNDGTTTNSSSKRQIQLTASQTVNSKTIFAYGTGENHILVGNYISKSYIDPDGHVFASSGDYDGAGKPKSVTINAGDPTVIFHKSLGTPTFKQLGAPDTSWTLVRENRVAGIANDITGKEKIEAPADYVIYQHEHTNGQGTWEITWAAK